MDTKSQYLYNVFRNILKHHKHADKISYLFKCTTWRKYDNCTTTSI